MTLKQRLLAVPALAGVLYFSVILAGMSGFDSSIWALCVALFLVWHVLMHVQGPPLPVVILVHAVVAAAFLGLGALIGGWIGAAVSPYAALALGALATGLARMVRISPEQAAELAAFAEEAAARMEAARAEAMPEPAPEPEPEAPATTAEADATTDAAPPSDTDPEPATDDEAEAELATLDQRLDRLPPESIRQQELAAAITPAIGPVPLAELVSALFARARANPAPRDLGAVTALLTAPHVAHARAGHGDSGAAFHLIRATGDALALSHWAAQTLAVIDLVPETAADLPDAQDLHEAAEACPAGAAALQELATRATGPHDEGQSA